MPDIHWFHCLDLHLWIVLNSCQIDYENKKKQDKEICWAKISSIIPKWLQLSGSQDKKKIEESLRQPRENKILVLLAEKKGMSTKVPCLWSFFIYSCCRRALGIVNIFLNKSYFIESQPLNTPNKGHYIYCYTKRRNLKKIMYNHYYLFNNYISLYIIKYYYLFNNYILVNLWHNDSGKPLWIDIVDQIRPAGHCLVYSINTWFKLLLLYLKYFIADIIIIRSRILPDSI